MTAVVHTHPFESLLLPNVCQVDLEPKSSRKRIGQGLEQVEARVDASALWTLSLIAVQQGKHGTSSRPLRAHRVWLQVVVCISLSFAHATRICAEGEPGCI